MVFSFADLVAALALNALRFQNASAKPLRHVVRFLHSDVGRALTKTLAAGAGEEQEPCVLLVTANGVALDTTPQELMKEQKVSVVYCLDAQHLVSDLVISSTEAIMRLDFQEPGPSGRVPRAKKKKPAKRRRSKLPALLREALARETGDKKKKKGKNK